MSAASSHTSDQHSVPSHVPAWAWALTAIALLAIFLIVQENGHLLSADAAQWLHEFTHDARHALGMPCH
jgi:hypothetical protein